MTDRKDEVAGLVFRRNEKIPLSDFQLDIQSFNVVMGLDGTRDAATIAQEEGFDLQELVERISQLRAKGLIESDAAHTKLPMPP